MVKSKKLLSLWAVMMLASSLAACTTEVETDDINFETGIRLTVIHTGDIHSRLLPYDMDLTSTDERIGMSQANEPFGGIARAATVVRNIRATAQHCVHVDSGDVFQGAPIFNEYNGEVEINALNYLGMDAFIIGNHEFDHGVANLYDKLSKAQFTILAANYQWKPTTGNEYLPLKDVARPYTILNADGVKVAVIGMANYSSMSSSTYGDNSLGITVLENIQVVQSYIDILKEEANILTMVTHLGLGEDEDVIRKTEGLDVVFGGHLHVVLNPPKIIPDNHVDVNGNPQPKMVPLVHSGAFMKYVGHFDGVFYPDYKVRPEVYVGAPASKIKNWDLTLVSHKYTPIPIESNIADDAELSLLLAPYERELARRLDLRHIVGYAPQTLKRFGTGGNDSPLGNYLADLMINRQRVEADFGATNSLGIRTDVNQGPVTNDQLYNVFPFPNSLSSMYLSGNEVWTLLDYNTYRSMNRGCQSQLQVAGVRYKLDCHTAKRVVDDYLDLGYLFEYQYRTDAFDAVCKRITPRPEYCEVTWEDKENPDNNIYNVHFAKDIKFVRGSCETDEDCAFSKEGIAKCEVITDTELGEYKACIETMQPQWLYKFATNDYMSHGGSGFSSLKYNTTQKNTGVMLREVLMDGIEKQKTCYDRCKDDEILKLGSNATDAEKEAAIANFEANPGVCKRLNNCKDDTRAFQLRWCKQLYKYSEQEVCLANSDTDMTGMGGSRCAGLNKRTELDLCLEAQYGKYCGNKFYPEDVAKCYADAQAGALFNADGTLVPSDLCAGKQAVSEYSACADVYLSDSKYASCKDLNTVSEYEKCVADAASVAAITCRDVSCFIASTDGRQVPIRPRNERFEGDMPEEGVTDNIDSFSNGPAIMEALQNAGYDACY